MSTVPEPQGEDKEVDTLKTKTLFPKGEQQRCFPLPNGSDDGVKGLVPCGVWGKAPGMLLIILQSMIIL